ncbi:MAG: Smr/MutS family protein, partial [Longimicrobiales bacterium]
TFRAARRRVEERAQRQAERARPPGRSPAAKEPARALAIGARVRVGATGAEGTLIELRDERATLDTGGLRLQVSASDLTPVEAAEPARAAAPRRTGGWTSPDFQVATEVDLRGLRADEVASQLLPALDAAISVGLTSLRIIHGKGTGALREVVTELLRGDRRVGSFRLGGLGEGGSGVTVVEL